MLVRLFLASVMAIMFCPSQSFATPLAPKPPKKDTLVLLHTPHGDMLIRLYTETPLHRRNFLKLASEGFYDSTTFHRVINDFMIQGGDPLTKDPKLANRAGTGGPGYTIPAEIVPGIHHTFGKVAAARLGDNVNPKRASSGSQFYIVEGNKLSADQMKRVAPRISQVTGGSYTLSDSIMEVYQEVGGTPMLDGQYTVFGEVIEGQEVIRTISSQATNRADRPVEDVRMRMEIVVMKRKKIVKKYGVVYPDLR